MIVNIKFPVAFAVMTALSVMGCSSMYDKHVEWEIEQPEQFPVLHAIGYAPISLQKAGSDTQKMLMAIEASKLAAYAELAEQVYGQQISRQTSVADLLVSNQSLSSSVQGVIRGAKVVKTYPMGDVYATELTVDFKEVYDLYITVTKPKKMKSINYY